MAVANVVQAVSLALNKVLFGARVAADRDGVSQLDTIGISYVVNLLLVFIALAMIFAVTGHYDPLHAPFEGQALRSMLALANPIAFVLMYLASLSWSIHDDAVEKRLAIKRTTNRFYRALLLFFVPALFINSCV